MRDVLQEFKAFNRQFALRNAELMRFKIERMAAGPFAFFRGTFHLFASDVVNGVVDLGSADGAAEFTIVGDLHCENYGTFKAEDRRVHYDVNDFDEATRGPFAFDVCRLTTSCFLAARENGLPVNEATGIVLAGAKAYAEKLCHAFKKGRSADFDVSEDSFSGCKRVDEIISACASRHRPAFIEALTEPEEHGRCLRRSSRYFELPQDERQRAERLLTDYRGRQTLEPPTKDYYAVEDVCGRVSGIGSMGRYRYAVLLTGKSSAESRNVLLEFKEARPSAYDLARSRDGGDAAVAARAAAVIDVQRQSQAAHSGHLGYAIDGNLSFQVRELGPADARVEMKTCKSTTDFECLAKVQGEILARIHGRSVGSALGPASAPANLSDLDRFCQRVLAFVLRYADLVNQDFDHFTKAKAELLDVASWTSAVSASSPGR